MASLNYEYLKNVAYIYPSLEDAEDGRGLGATAFFAAVWKDPYAEELEGRIYCVTNAHVVEAAEKSLQQAPVVHLRVNTKSGSTSVLPIDCDRWYRHPEGDDLAIVPVEYNPEWDFRVVNPEQFLKEQDLERYSIGVGDETTTIGRFIKHGGRVRNLPAVRYGRVSMLPLEPIAQRPVREFDQQSFLVETHSINGYSGSPVFTHIPLDGRVAPQQLPEAKTFLLGIDWGHFDFTGEVRVEPDTLRLKVPSGMMCVVPAWRLTQLMEHVNLQLDSEETGHLAERES